MSHISTSTPHAWDLVRIYLLTPMENGNQGMPVYLEGDPGIGKSARTRQVGAELGLYTHAYFGSSMLPEDIPGLPHLADYGAERKRSAFSVPDMVVRAESAPSILFFDEATTAERAVQNVLLGVIQERHCGLHPLPPRTRIVLAANPATNISGTNFSEAMANRVAHIRVGADHRAWGAWMMSHGRNDQVAFGDIEAQEAKVAAEWNTWWPLVKGAFLGFIEQDPDRLQARPDGPDRLGPWPSQRSVTDAMHAATTAFCLGKRDLLVHVIGCIVGQGWAREFVAYLADAKLPNPNDVLDGKAQLPTLELRRADRSYAMAVALGTAIIGDHEGDTGDARIDRFWKALASIQKVNPDIGSLVARQVMQHASTSPALIMASAATDMAVDAEIDFRRAKAQL